MPVAAKPNLPFTLLNDSCTNQSLVQELRFGQSVAQRGACSTSASYGVPFYYLK
jgi:hypothetical protein